jgi:hypothetical protein
MTSDSDTRIEERAYAIWEAEGRPHGRHDEHWHRAAQEIARESDEASSQPAPSGGSSQAGSVPGLRSHPAASPQANGAKSGTPVEAGKGEPGRRARRSAPASS